MYPIYQKLFNKTVWRGREEFVAFATGFDERWKDARIITHESIAEENRVVFVWSYTEKRTTAENPEIHEYRWVGITVVHFNEDNKITAE